MNDAHRLWDLGLGRRSLLRSTAALGSAAALSTLLPPAAHGTSAEDDPYTSRALFDEIDREFRARGPGPGQATDTNDHGMLAWYQTYFLQGYMLMYEAYHDTHYLDLLVGNVEQILANRDCERGVTDYRGLSLPAWRAMDPFTVAKADLTDGSGRPLLEVRSAVTSANESTAFATVLSAPAQSLFTLTMTNTVRKYSQTFTGLSLDPASPNYAVTRLYNEFPNTYPGTSMQVTARDLRAVRNPADVPKAGTQGLTPQSLIFGVHTGILTYPIAKFIRTVFRNPRLRHRYQATADRFLQAVEAAVAVHDHEFFHLPDGSGAYRWAKGAPVAFDGCEWPLNMKDALSSTYLELAVATGKPEYKQRASQLALSTKGQFTPGANGETVWHYHPTYSSIYQGFTKTGSPESDRSLYVPSYGGARGYEDVGHGAISVDFAAMACTFGYIFTTQDMLGLAGTVRQNILTHVDGKASAYPNVDGGGVAGTASQLHSSGMWLRLATWDRGIFPLVHEVYRDNNLTKSAVGIAFLNWAARL